ncbi:MAG: 4'-phosphopantetheinyl transferase superfamily protein [Sphingomonas sp.]
MATVAVHFASLAASSSELEVFARVIDDQERARAARFRFANDRRRYIVRRAKLRQSLAILTGAAPEALRFYVSAHGKPELPHGPRFSLSHSADRMMLATADVDIGCDIERVDPAIDWRPLAEGLFAPAERRSLAGLPKAAAHDAFFACWARKEAFVKAIGLGLSYPLDAFAVSVTQAAELISGGTGWAISASDAPTGYAAAVVARDDGQPFVLQPSHE